MKLNDLITYYGNSDNFVKKTGMARNCWFIWKRKGYVPIKSQYRIEGLTSGTLKADFEHAGLK
ncbi:MAG: hypothetical protein AB7F29_13720 [Candidatus Nitrosocosmicus sp.]